MNALPYFVSTFTNASGTTSYRVSGSWKGERIRKNYADRGLAEAFCNSKNVEALKAPTTLPAWAVVQTRLSEVDVRMAESAVAQLNGRWTFRELVTAGLATLESKPAIEPLAPLAEQYLTLREGELAPLSLKALRLDLDRFIRFHPTLTTATLERAAVRKWLDDADVSRVTKTHWRAALHQFCRWLVERGLLKENPVSGIKVAGSTSGASRSNRPPPAIFTPLQAETLLRVCESTECRPLLGWMATCLFTGMRPESEAPRTTWTELNFETGEWSVMGQKRGAKPRVIKLQPAAIEWLKVVKQSGEDHVALYSKWLRRLAVKKANKILAELHPQEKAIKWEADITRHTFASYRSPQIPVHALAAEMGNSPSIIYAHYRRLVAAASVGAFWAVRPTA